MVSPILWSKGTNPSALKCGKVPSRDLLTPRIRHFYSDSVLGPPKGDVRRRVLTICL